MADSRQNNTELLDELRSLRMRVAELETAAEGLTPLQDSLRESEEKFRLLAENVPGVIYLRANDSRHSLLFLNDECEIITGYPKEDFLDHRRFFVDLYHPDDAESILGAMTRAIEKGCPFHLVYRIKHASGRYCWVEEFGTGVFDENDETLLYVEGFLHDITERKRVEEDLQRERRLFMGGPVVVFRWTARSGWPVQYVSPNVSGILGYGADEFMSGGVRFADVIHPDDIEHVTDEVLADSLEGIDCFEQDYRIIRSDGKVRWLYVFMTVVRDERGTITHYEGYALDVTERKNTEQEHLSRLERIQNQQTAIVTLATHETVTGGEFREAVRTITQITSDTLVVQRVSVWLLDDDRKILRCVDLFDQSEGSHSEGHELDIHSYPRYFEAATTGRAIDASDARTDPRTAEFREGYLEPSGIVSMLDAPVRSGGEIIGVVCHEHVGKPRSWQADEITFAGEVADQVAQAISNSARRKAEESLQESLELLEDHVNERTAELAKANEQLKAEIAERARVEEALRESEERFRKISSSAQDAIIMSDEQGRVSFWNEAAETIFGYPRKEILGKNLHEILAPARFREAHRIALPVFASTGQGAAVGQTLELAGLRKNGEEFPIELSLSAVRIKGGWHAIAVIRDIARRKRNELMLRRSERLASVGTLAARIAHEITHPLGAILLDAQLAMQFNHKLDGSGKSLQNIIDHAKRCNGVVKDLLQFAKDQSSAKWPSDILQIVRQACEAMQEEAKKRGVEMSLKMEDVYPPLPLNPPGIEQVFRSVIKNAIQACGRKGHVTIQTGGITDDGIWLLVTDDGCGVASADRERIFDPFFSAWAESTSAGLGLSMAHGIITEHGGTIEIESEDGEGTTLSIHLPLEATDAAAS